jgi:putative ABC transport system ATP-binding protein
MNPILQTEDLHKVYATVAGELHALAGVALAVEAGEFVAVMGPSGCGKSTLLHMLGGLDNPTSGTIHLAGQRIDRMNETKRALLRRHKLGFVFQDFNLIGNLTAEDNVELPALLAGMNATTARQQCQRLMSELGIADKAHSIPAQLSGGQQQRVALARALINHPAILLADEPTGNLDSTNADYVLRLLRQFHRQGQTILMVTHDPSVASVADRVIYMRDGRIQNDIQLQGDQKPRMALGQLIALEG